MKDQPLLPGEVTFERVSQPSQVVLGLYERSTYSFEIGMREERVEVRYEFAVSVARNIHGPYGESPKTTLDAYASSVEETLSSAIADVCTTDARRVLDNKTCEVTSDDCR